MIRINKPVYPPEVRFERGNHPKKGQLKWRVAFAQLLADYRADENKFINEKYAFSADFGRKEYNLALKACQGNKCCFCEKPVGVADIEHFRPKSAWQDTRGGRLNKPGYFWLAYSWSNMLIACNDCNSQANKGNLFPVRGLRSVYPSDCRTEDKILINPAEEDPADYITFMGDNPVGRDVDGRGDENIAILNLRDRGDIKETRRDRLRSYRAMKKLSLLPPGILSALEMKEAKIYLAQAQKVKSPFAGMIRENERNGLI